jgi:adenosine deaminase
MMDKTCAAALAADDLAYHDRVVAEEAAAQQLLQQAQIRAAKAEAVASSWWAHLKDSYALVEEDTVAPDGTISRVPRAADA